ncbi:MAG: hypothetical protein H0T76_00455 [Nannocystis sp.]|nr:hypothetical protein [Nannocystis sp.]MBA3544930.1 hypothetical protein [Nannocystis sp.]
MLRPTVALAIAVAVALAGCADNFDADLKAVEDAPYLSTGGSTGEPPTTGPDTVTTTSGGTTGSATSDDGETTGSAMMTTDAGDSTTTGADTGEDADSSSGGALPPPTILEVDMPGKVALAGPVPFTTTTANATSARAKLDGVDIGALQDDGGGVFSGALAIYGAVDNGDHVLEIIAEREDLSDHRPVPFEVSTPASGTVAWAKAGPAGTRTRRIALTPERDVIEVGTRVIAGVERPVIRKRSGLTGAELWAEGTIVIDDREGWAVDVAVAPDGQLWAAMNVRTAANVWRPRIALFDAAGHFTGVEIIGEAGQTVTGLDNDGTGGCVAVGFAGSGKGDTDVVVWRMNGDHVPVLSGKSWDYVPGGELAHTFTDLATEVVVKDGVAWIVGLSVGKHDDKADILSRGFVLRLDIDTAAELGPVIIAPKSGAWTQSKFFGAAAHPDGVLVTGNACNNVCDSERVETALYTNAGGRPWFRPEPASVSARGNAVALNAHGGVVVAVTIREGTALRGYLLGRVVYDGQATPFSVPFPASKEDSEASAVAIDEFDRIAGGGYRTLGGVTESRTILAHP